MNSDDIKGTLDIIDGPVYDNMSTGKLKYLLLRLDSFKADPPLDYDKVRKITISMSFHQNIANINDWPGWSEDDINFWKHRLGNLVLLSDVKNSEAGRKPFKTKTAIYLGEGDGKVACFATTRDVFYEPDKKTLR